MQTSSQALAMSRVQILYDGDAGASYVMFYIANVPFPKRSDRRLTSNRVEGQDSVPSGHAISGCQALAGDEVRQLPGLNIPVAESVKVDRYIEGHTCSVRRKAGTYLPRYQVCTLGKSDSHDAGLSQPMIWLQKSFLTCIENGQGSCWPGNFLRCTSRCFGGVKCVKISQRRGRTPTKAEPDP